MTAVIDNGTLILRNVGSYYSLLTSTGKLKWDKKTQSLRGTADLELLDTLSSIMRLPLELEAERRKMREVRQAIDRERIEAEPTPLVHYPVKARLLKHQIRGANMALLAFGAIRADEWERRGAV